MMLKGIPLLTFVICLEGLGVAAKSSSCLPNGIKCERLENVDIQINDLKNKEMASGGEKGCASWCWETRGCFYWSHRRVDNWCFLKTAGNYRASVEGVSSGNKVCGTDTEPTCIDYATEPSERKETTPWTPNHKMPLL